MKYVWILQEAYCKISAQKLPISFAQFSEWD